jgi:hypothetical protein
MSIITQAERDADLRAALAGKTPEQMAALAVAAAANNTASAEASARLASETAAAEDTAFAVKVNATMLNRDGSHDPAFVRLQALHDGLLSRVSALETTIATMASDHAAELARLSSALAGQAGTK